MHVMFNMLLSHPGPTPPLAWVILKVKVELAPVYRPRKSETSVVREILMEGKSNHLTVCWGQKPLSHDQ